MTTANYSPARTYARLTPGKALRIARELQGLSQSQLARKTGIAQSALSALESGDTEMGLKRARVLARALGVHPAVIAFPDWNAPIVDLSERRTVTRRVAAMATPGNRRRKTAR